MFNRLKTNEVGLLLHGLRSMYVADEQQAQTKLIRMLETELASRGLTLREPGSTLPFRQRRGIAEYHASLH
jgi:hypothetical protein